MSDKEKHGETVESLKKVADGLPLIQLPDEMNTAGTALLHSFRDRIDDEDWEPPADVNGWRDPKRPLKFELQLLHFADQALDVFEFGLGASYRRPGPTAYGCLRYLGETAAVMMWLAEPSEEGVRQSRAFALQYAGLGREIEMMEWIRDLEGDPFRVASDQAKIESLTELRSDIRKLCPVPLQNPPGRREMFDDFMRRFGGYGFFSMTSELGSHPGFSIGALFPHDFDDRTLREVYLASGMALLFKEVVRVIADTFAWVLDDELGVSLFAVDALAMSIGERWENRVWGSQ